MKALRDGQSGDSWVWHGRVFIKLYVMDFVVLVCHEILFFRSFKNVKSTGSPQAVQEQAVSWTGPTDHHSSLSLPQVF